MKEKKILCVGGFEVGKENFVLLCRPPQLDMELLTRDAFWELQNLLEYPYEWQIEFEERFGKNADEEFRDDIFWLWAMQDISITLYDLSLDKELAKIPTDEIGEMIEEIGLDSFLDSYGKDTFLEKVR